MKTQYANAVNAARRRAQSLGGRVIHEGGPGRLPDGDGIRPWRERRLNGEAVHEDIRGKGQARRTTR